MIAASKKTYRTIGKAVAKPEANWNAKAPLQIRLIRMAFRWLGPLAPKYACLKAYHLFTSPMMRARHRQPDTLLSKARITEFLYGKRLLKKYSWGTGEKSVILSHGWQSRGTALRGFVPDLLEAGYQVIAFDAPAHGDSPGKRVNLPVFSGLITTLLEQHAPVEAVIAHSFGGASTLFGMLEEKENAHLPKLVLVASPVNVCWVVEDYLRYIQVSDKIAALFKKHIAGKMKMDFSMGDTTQYFDQLPIDRTLIIHDKQDASVPFEMSEKIFQRYANIELIATEGLGHSKILKHPDVIKAVKDFILLS